MRIKHRTLAAVVAVGIVCLGATGALAQGYGYGRNSAAGRIQRPTVSPYLNLYRQGSNGLPNYQTLVRPELQQLRTNQYQQYEIGSLRNQIVAEQRQNQASSLPQTGHESRFRYYSHFYSRKR